MILAVGPTGSGKTTTLHALLGAINTVERKIWTAEDPVEITQDGLRQVQVNPKIDFTFANALRSFLRADPDVIMVGEMRDHETASIGIEASLTGHLVFSTLHTNSAPETVTRLVDMGLDPFSFADALIAILAQRLARRLCSNCKDSYSPSPDERAEIEEIYGAEKLQERLDGQPLVLYEAKGCPKCDHKGYQGRVGIHELLLSNEQIRASIQRRENVDDLRHTARESGMRTLVQDGIDKALDGLTDLRQVFAVCSY
jgi:type II secretory ATPase GspE/PulE/Tfp pilus assembly ATPase PilB-like protein